MDKEKFSQRYSKMTNEQLLCEMGLASQIVAPAAAALQEEINRRGLDSTLVPDHHKDGQFSGGEMNFAKVWSWYRKFYYWAAIFVFALFAVFIVVDLIQS